MKERFSLACILFYATTLWDDTTWVNSSWIKATSPTARDSLPGLHCRLLQFSFLTLIQSSVTETLDQTTEEYSISSPSKSLELILHTFLNLHSELLCCHFCSILVCIILYAGSHMCPFKNTASTMFEAHSDVPYSTCLRIMMLKPYPNHNLVTHTYEYILSYIEWSWFAKCSLYVRYCGG